MSAKSTFELISINIQILKINIRFLYLLSNTYIHKFLHYKHTTFTFHLQIEVLYCSRYIHFLDRSNLP